MERSTRQSEGVDDDYQNVFDQNSNNQQSDLRPQNDQDDDEDPIRHRYTLYAKVADYHNLAKVRKFLFEKSIILQNRMNVLFVVKI